MVRKIVHIDEEKCNGCGACANACHENAIGMVNGKAKLLRDDYCDGMGDCLPECPTGAITFEEREALAYDEAAVKANQKRMEIQKKMKAMVGGCPGSQIRQMNPEMVSVSAKPSGCPGSTPRTLGAAPSACPGSAPASIAVESADVTASFAPVTVPSQLRNWPVQIKLAPIKAPYFAGVKLLIAADCTAYSYASFHQDFIRGKVTLIGCPKLDSIDYSEKLTQIIAENDIQSVTIVRMEVPCCGGLEMAAKKALQASGKFIPWQVVTISIDGKILD